MSDLAKKLRENIFAPPSDCKWCKGVSAGPIGVHYACMNEKCKRYGMQPPICDKDCEGYENV